MQLFQNPNTEQMFVVPSSELRLLSCDAGMAYRTRTVQRTMFSIHVDYAFVIVFSPMISFSLPASLLHIAIAVCI